jgi:hypothetical protein
MSKVSGVSSSCWIKKQHVNPGDLHADRNDTFLVNLQSVIFHCVDEYHRSTQDLSKISCDWQFKSSNSCKGAKRMTAARTTPKANADLFDLVTEMVDMLRLERPSEMFGGVSKYGRATCISVSQEKTMIYFDVNGIKSEERKEKGEKANHILLS